MRDGAVLLAEHHIPATDHPMGTVLVRTPYGRRSALDALSSRVLAVRGYHVLVQSVRGTFGSGGVFDPMVDEERDGHDTVAWLREQPWFDGRLATYGASYLGWTQWTVLTDPPPELRAAVVLVAPHDFAASVYSTGAFALQGFLSLERPHPAPGDHRSARGASRAASPPSGGWHRGTAACRRPTPSTRCSKGARRGFGGWLAAPRPHRPVLGRHARHDGAGALHGADTARRRLAGPVPRADAGAVSRPSSARGVDVALTVGPWTHVAVGIRGAGVVARETLSWLDEHLAGATRAAPARPGAGLPHRRARVAARCRRGRRRPTPRDVVARPGGAPGRPSRRPPSTRRPSAARRSSATTPPTPRPRWAGDSSPPTRGSGTTGASPPAPTS